MTDAEILERGRRVLRIEQTAIAQAEQRLGDDFVRAVRLIAESPGRVIVAGVGKSGIIAHKIAATLTLTGTPATFLHPVDSLHGDLGLVGPTDTAILVSKSGDSNELLVLLEQLKRLGVRSVALTGDRASPLAHYADVTLDAGVDEEACPHDLTPTTSTTVALAIGDALAVALLEEKGFKREDFARLHPGGALGRQLLTRVSEVMLKDAIPLLTTSATMREAIVRIAEHRGIVIIEDGAGHIVGVITVGDLTRLLKREENVFPIPVQSVMTRTPKTARPDELGSAVVYRMQQMSIISMPVVDEANTVVGVVHLHDLMRAGVA